MTLSARGRAVGITFLVVLAAVGAAVFLWARNHIPRPGRVLDEALVAGRDASTWGGDALRDMGL